MSRRALGVFLSLTSFVASLAAVPVAYAGSTGKQAEVRKAATKTSKSGKSSKASKSARSARPAKPGKAQASKASKTPASSKQSQQAQKAAAERVVKAPAAPTSATVVPAAVMSVGEQFGLHRTPDPLSLRSSVALVVDQHSAEVLFEKNAEVALPIASLTKLMTALVVVEARQDLDEVLEITADDIDREKNSGSRLRVGTQMTRAEMLHLALMSSENRAASALGRHYPGGLPAFVSAMNARARTLGMTDTRFVDSTGLSSRNVASARDLARLAVAAHRYPLIREYSTYPRHAVDAGGHQLQYMNSNRLVNHPDWDIGLQKTGYISEAGRCLLMQTRIGNRPVVMVFLDSRGKESRLADAARIRKWLEMPNQQTMTLTSARRS